MLKHCDQCALRSPNQGICQLTKLPFQPKDPACANFCLCLTKCELCGRKFPKLSTIMDGYYVCDDCLLSLGTCSQCKHQNQCDFETNPSTLPKIVQKVIHQGNMQMATQIRNPEREKITCACGCPCYMESIGCLRQEGTCGKYIFKKS